MNKQQISIWIMMFLVTICYPVSITSKGLSGQEILKRSDDILVPDKDIEVDWNTIAYRPRKKPRKDGEKVFKSQDNKKLLVLQVYPIKNKGEATLIIDHNVWVYMPKIRKSLHRRLKDSFLGTDFSNDDLPRNKLSANYRAQLVKTEKIKVRLDVESEVNASKNAKQVSIRAYKLKLTPKNKHATYGKILVWVSTQNFIPLKRQMYTLSGKHIKTLTFSTLEKLPTGVYSPMKQLMTNEIIKGNRTLFVAKNMKLRQLHEKIFTKRYMESQAR